MDSQWHPANALLLRVDAVSHNDDDDEVTVSGATIDDESVTVKASSIPDDSLNAGEWYLVHPTTGEEPVYVTDEAEWEHRGTSDDLDDWLLPDGQGYLRRGNSFTVQTAGGGPPPTGTGSRKYFSSQSSKSPERLRSTSPMSADATADAVEHAATLNSESMESVPAEAGDIDEDVGFAVGGEKDFTNARDNILNGLVPQPDAMSVEGLFYDYHFETGDEAPKRDALFYPSYARGVTRNPVTGDIEEYLAVGLNSNLSAADFERKPLDLAVVVDVSGSMGSGFDEYYYDDPGAERDGEQLTKMEAAADALQGLTEQLGEEDRMGVVAYNNEAHRLKPLRSVEGTDMDAVRDHIGDLEDSGGTDLSAGFDTAVEMLEDEAERNDPTDRETRIIFLTDEMPNKGRTTVNRLVGDFKAAAERGIHTTFVGIGLDANPELGNKISEVRGANHYFIHSPDEFRRRLADEFEYMVTPLVYDLNLTVEGEGYEVVDVHGAPSDDDELLHVSTLFPSPPDDDGRGKGSIMLVELERTRPDPELELKAGWTLRDGSTNGDVIRPDFDDPEPEYFAHSGVRKAVSLVRYASTLKEWAENVRNEEDDNLGDWEHQSRPVNVSDEFRDRLQAIRADLESAQERTGDDDLEQEVAVIDALLETVE